MNYYQNKLEEGKQFEDHVKRIFFERFAIDLDFTGKDNQVNIGETLQGIEVKYDGRFKETGNIYIEVAEKSHPDNQEYVVSGVFRDDNTWLYVIGDYDTLYIFSKKHLKLLKDGCNPVVTPTSMGFLVPKQLAEKECILKLVGEPKESESK